MNQYLMQIKSYDKQGLIAWSNSKAHSELLVSAALEPDEQNLYHIDVLSLDLQERSKKMNVIGNAYVDSSIRCIAWDTFGEKENTYPYGTIFTGFENGSFALWDPFQMINTYQQQEAPSLDNIEQQTCLIYAEEPEDNAFPIMCAEWNGLKQNFLAFGSTDVLLVDISKDPTNPQLVKPGKKNPHDGSYVTSVSWNKQVPHILASASENGLIALWDIKSDTSIFQFKDSGASSSGNRNVVICWSKNISTQIAVTLDDQKRNQLQIWDLRNQKGPVVVIDKYHNRGINTMDWCQTDPELILTASRDKKVVCWNYTQQDQPLSQTQLSSAAFNVQWSKKLPSIYSVSTQSKTTICTLSDANLFSYVPKWYKVPVASTFLANQAVLTYSENRGRVLHENVLHDLAKPSIVKQKLKSLATLIFSKTHLVDSELANLLKAKNSVEGDTQIYDYLGFNKSKIVKEVQKYTGKKREFVTGPSNKEKAANKAKTKAYTQLMGKEAFSFFEEIGVKSNQLSNKNEDEETNENIKYDMVPRNFDWDMGKERLIKQNILIGNYEGAIDAALKCGRTAEALIIAYSVDQNLFNNTLKTFFTETTDNFITDVLKQIAYKDAQELVNKYDLSKWKECVALIYSIVSREKRPHFLKLLASRLKFETDENYENQNDVISEANAIVMCYILAEDFNQIAKVYNNNLNKVKPEVRKITAIQYGQRLVAILQSLTVNTGESKQFQKIMREIAFICIEENDKALAHSIFTTFVPQGSMRLIDYLVHSTKELEKYKTSITYKHSQLPVMQIKRQDKKINKTVENNTSGKNNQKKPIFSKENQLKSKKYQENDQDNYRQNPIKKPPPMPPSSVEDPYAPVQKQNTILSKKNIPPPPSKPYEEENEEKEKAHKNPHVVKKTQPPPPPVPIKRHEQQDVGNVNPVKKGLPPPKKAEEEQAGFSPYDQTQKRGPVIAKKANNPPPPPPPPVNQKKVIQEEEEVKQTIQPKKLPPPVANKSISHKEQQEEENEQFVRKGPSKFVPQPLAIEKKSIPPPISPMKARREVDQPEEEERQQIRKVQQPVQKKKVPPPPLVASKQQQETQPVRSEKVVKQPSVVARKVENKWEEQQQTTQKVTVKQNPPPPPPPAKRGQPPPPPRRQ